MMDVLVRHILNMSLTASYVILAVCLARLLLKRAPRVVSYALWAVVGFRLAVPFSFESAFSLLPFRAEPIPQSVLLHENVSFIAALDAAAHAVGDAVNGGLGTIPVYVDRLPEGVTVPVITAYHSQVWMVFFSYIWAIGLAAILAYSVISVLRLRRNTRSAVCAGGNVYEDNRLKTPFLMGFLRPKIYLPQGLADEERRYILLHEQTHVRRGDHIVKPIAFLLLCVHWFNPLVWLAFALMNADMEQACDEAVLRTLGGDIKKAYSHSLLNWSMGGRVFNGSPLAFGEGGVKGRVKNVLQFKKPARIAVIAAVALAAALAIGFAANRKTAPVREPFVFGAESDVAFFKASEEAVHPNFISVSAQLMNIKQESMTCGEAFTLVQERNSAWEIVPFKDGVGFKEIAWILENGQSLTYSLTPNMLTAKLAEGRYRIVTEVWVGGETDAPVGHTVWAEFRVDKSAAKQEMLTMPEGWSGNPNGKEMTIADVRELAKKGNGLRLADFQEFRGANVSSSYNYLMLYSVENGNFRLIVDTEADAVPRGVNLEWVWADGGSGIDIRTGDLEAFLRQYPMAIHVRPETVTPAGATFVLRRCSEEEWTYGDEYTIQRKTENGDWIAAAEIADDVSFHLLAYLIEPFGAAEVAVDWGWLYGELPSGQYRFGKTILLSHEPGDYDTKTIWALFEVE